ncbi:chemotaxis protein CheA [Lacticigenium naphthae]|uniref:chemotaxis protein CheA n=1 Tax=Lacticigenium naphthae TaxID=515351 RepID=UPI0004059C14|nr:chemotaxis protein CheA [Lacticigenium naphthae]
MEDNSQYRDLFFEETDENLEHLNEGVLQLEQTPDDDALLNSIFRNAHTLKGMAATMGYETMATLTHRMENVFDLFKRNEVQVSSDSISLVFDCLDTLTDIVEDLRAEGTGDKDISTLVERLENIAKQESDKIVVTAIEANADAEDSEFAIPTVFETMDSSDFTVIEAAKESGYNVFTVGFQIEQDSMMKSARAYLAINKLDQEGEIVFSQPATEIIESSEFNEDVFIVLVTKLDQEAIKNLIDDLSEIEAVKVEPFKEPADLELDESPEEEGSSAVVEAIQSTSTDKKPAKASRSMKQTIRVDLSKLDQFMNLVSELVIHRTRLEELTDQTQAELHEPVEQVGRITTELQELVLQLRMQPFNVVVQRFPRMVRDLANELNKDIELVMEGESTELDRTVVSELGEPLIHLLRNACDHGIEMPAERKASGKSEQGIVKVSAYPEGNRVIVTVSDDGKGLDPVALKASAERKGIPTEGMSDKDAQQLIFHPGFSTAQKVTGISGRGVGMDVVKEKISSLNGTIETISEVGKGSAFKIVLPLTLSIIQALMIKSGTETFALPQSVIEKVVVYNADEVDTIHKQQVYRYKNMFIPVTRLTESLELVQQPDKKEHVVIVLLGDQYHALVVDDIIHQREIVIKKFGSELKEVKKYLGASILGNGEVVLILDLTSVCTERKGVTV